MSIKKSDLLTPQIYIYIYTYIYIYIYNIYIYIHLRGLTQTLKNGGWKTDPFLLAFGNFSGDMLNFGMVSILWMWPPDSNSGK